MTKYAFFDIETTGLDYKSGHKIIELAVSVYDDSDGWTVTYEQRVNPKRAIDPEAQKVHKISFNELQDKPTFKEVVKDFLEVLEDADVMVAHNGDDFDFPFLKHELESIGVEPPKCLSKTIDTMVKGRWATPMGKLPSLKELCFACDVEYDPEKAHSALYDTDVLMKCFLRGMTRNHWD